ncbi:hydrolase [Dehalogenimonas sp. WBC-2]|nr:hydrolase [Dehalogenimonas sp. WBC-2]
MTQFSSKGSWLNWHHRIGVAIGIAAASGLLSAWLTPRGPITASEALVSLIGALVIGIVGGFFTKTRWSMLVMPAVFIIVFELVRLGTDGPTVDGIHLGTTYGIIAFVLGRGVHALIVILPMILGVVIGVMIAMQLGRSRIGVVGRIGQIFTSLGMLALIAFTFFIAQPAHTEPILGPDGKPLPGSVTELTTVRIGNSDQALMIRGKSVDNPVLLYLAGGPGGTDLGAMRLSGALLENDFVVVTWEQRGSGKSYSALDPQETLTLSQMVADTIELTNYLRNRFNEGKIYLVGNSWGTIPGVLAAQQHPELYHAYIGTGQMVSPRETDIMFYEDTLAWAERTGNDELVTILRKNGPPPYNDFRAYEPALSYEHDWNSYSMSGTNKEMPANLFVPENTLMDKVNGLRGFLDTFAVLYPQLQDIDFRRDVPKLGIPVYMVIGNYEARGRAVLANEWFETLDAPFTEMIVFKSSGHRPSFEEPHAFASLMAEVLSDTYAVSHA